MDNKKMYFINSDKKVISKDISKNLISLYLNMGWTIEKPKEENKEEIKQVREINHEFNKKIIKK